MKELPAKYVLPIKPAEYLKQGFSHCGAYSVKGILSAYGLDNKGHPKEYHPGWFGRFTGVTLNSQYWPRVLRSHGLRAEVKSAKHIPGNKKLDVLKQLLVEGNPVMVSIGNGYLPNGEYNAFRGKVVVGHWITVWGYDDEEKAFFVYDSAVPKDRYDKSVPVGNIKRTYTQMLRDWKGALIVKIIRGFEDYHYIEIKLS